MNHRIILILILGLFDQSMQAFPQSNDIRLRLDLSVRQRFEIWDGMNARNYGDDSPEATGNLNDKLLYQRIITGFTWSPSEKLTVAAHLQDSRAFGWSLRQNQYPDLFEIKAAGTSEPSYTMNPNEEFVELYDGFIEYRNLVPGLSAKLGRQKIFYGDNHIFGPGDLQPVAGKPSGKATWLALQLLFTLN